MIAAHECITGLVPSKRLLSQADSSLIEDKALEIWKNFIVYELSSMGETKQKYDVVQLKKDVLHWSEVSDK